MAHLLELLREFLANYGYWAVAVTLLLENAGLPLPGETILLLASFSAFSEHRLRLAYVIVVGIGSATVGDNIGFAIGHYGGRRVLARYVNTLRISEAAIRRAEEFFQRYGAATVFLARFVTGLRVLAGPLAGVLRMHWKKFVLFNFFGAVLWVAVISTVGYLFGRHWGKVARIMERSDILFAAVAGVVIVWVWFRLHRAAD